MTDVKSGIKGLFENAENVKDGKMSKDELQKVCVTLGMDESEVATMFDEIDKDAGEIAVDSFLDWVFAKEDAPAGDAVAEAPAEEAGGDDEDLDDEDDDVDDVLDEPPPPRKTGARSSVSAEAYGAWNVKKAFDPPKYEKTDEQNKRIKDVLSKSFLFQAVDPKDFEVLLGAVQEEKAEEKSRVIKQGDDGDFLCIIEEGTFDCYIEKDGEEKCVKTCVPGEVFGELALMYNCPRAASVEATSEGKYWKLDRETFNHIVRDAAQQKREKYEQFLKSVELLGKMTAWERAQVADALKEEEVKDGDVIVTEGEEGDKFYILADGEALASKADCDDLTYKAGDYFGELALMNDCPRKATVTSKGCKVLSLDRKSFKRLLGSVDELGKKNYLTDDSSA